LSNGAQASVRLKGLAPAPIALQDMLHALREVRPSAMREVVLEVPKVRGRNVELISGI